MIPLRPRKGEIKVARATGTGSSRGEWNDWNIDSLAPPEQCDRAREGGEELRSSTPLATRAVDERGE